MAKVFSVRWVDVSKFFGGSQSDFSAYLSFLVSKYDFYADQPHRYVNV